MRHGDRRPGVSVGEGGVIGDSHSPRQVSHRGYGGKPAFLWQLLFDFQPTWLVASDQNSAKGCQRHKRRAAGFGERERGGTGGSRSLPACTQPLDCQAADSTAAILWRKKKTKTYRFNGLQGFLQTRSEGSKCDEGFQEIPERAAGSGSGCLGPGGNIFIVAPCFFFHGAIMSCARQQHGNTALKLKCTRGQTC